MALPASAFVNAMLELPLEHRAAFLETLPRARRKALRYTWKLWARPGQMWIPGDEIFTVYLAGRAFGKTRVGAEAVRYVAAHPELCGGVIGIAGRTANDVNQTMIYGVSGIMSCYPANERPKHYKSSKILEWKNGVIARLFSGQEPASFRGPNFGFLWADEWAHWQHLKEAWEAAKFALRLGAYPRCVITTTPIGSEEVERLVWEWDEEIDGPKVADADTALDRILDGFKIHPQVRVVTGDTYDNAANLPPSYLAGIVGASEGTVVADQEVRGKILRDVPTACFTRGSIARGESVDFDSLRHVVVAVDPSGTIGNKARPGAEVGIVASGEDDNGLLNVLEDASGRMGPDAWGKKVWEVADRWDADEILAEGNYGGELVRTVLANARPRASLSRLRIVTAHKGKAERAALVRPHYDVGRCRHIGNPRQFVALERQMCSWDPTKPESSQPSPDRMDALVWSMLGLVSDGSDLRMARAMSDPQVWAEIRRRVAGKLAM